jgi:Flp pilus assembly protein TadB
LRPLLAGVAFAGGWALLGGVIGWAGGLAAAMAVWVVLGRTEDPSVVRRRERLLDDLPTGIDLLAACLDAGSAPESALATVSRALGGPVGEEFLSIHHRLEIGVDPRQVWRSISTHDQLGPLGRAVGRAHETGAPVGRAVHQLAEELRARARSDVEARARSIEVKAAAPLGLCLLPAFVVLGVVPLVAGVFGAMRLF